MNAFSVGNVFKAGVVGGIAAGALNFGVYFLGAALGAKYLGDNGGGGLGSSCRTARSTCP